ncbi:hypothetical protein D5R40_31645 [Okeania hirsuta]|uniref:Peptidase M61 catalytic domain-containing protein n=1 Tax=Okeania hirsuta TaxID=1458930 RepID=A0A3N6NS67_9CYAN|nr:hypothetical protein D5R40_31645 [Okeania hirsuta]
MCGELWFASCFTSYYDDLILCRAGILNTDQYVRGLTGTLTMSTILPEDSIEIRSR